MYKRLEKVILITFAVLAVGLGVWARNSRPQLQPADG